VKRVKLKKQTQVFITKYQENKDKMKAPTDVRKKDPIKNLHKSTEEKINNIKKKIKKITNEIEKLQSEN
jgi:dsDNA-specific endonuclease/ATPase MutS2